MESPNFEVQRRIRRVLIANRGEIAIRILRACRALEIEVIAAVSEADKDSLVARLADGVAVIGPAPATQSYLRADLLISAATNHACDAVHPGYGFLSERSTFAQQCTDAGLIFIGPSPQTIKAIGDKITAGELATKAGVPRLPGSNAVPDAKEARHTANEIGYPVLLKAAAGGGGRGMRVVRSESDIEAAFESASKEAQASFNDRTLYVEKFIENSRHIEIQVIGDQHGNVIHLGERECSTQRRHQKLIEEAPSPALSEHIRSRMSECAVQLAKSVGYFSAGTVEFLMDTRDGSFYFLEMNTRIQVEHPVTEMVTGIDLLIEQIRVACGLPLVFNQADIRLNGHAIECRINAEDPDRNFLPRAGVVTEWHPPSGDGIRVDSHCFSGMEISPYYDSLLAKVVVHAPTREEAIALMDRTLLSLKVTGPATTAPFHRSVLKHSDFKHGRVTTRWVEDVFLPQRKQTLNAANAEPSA